MAKKVDKEVGYTTKQAQELFEDIYIKFITGTPDQEILDRLLQIETTKFVEYNTWIHIRSLIMLKCHLSQDFDAVQVACRNRVSAVTNSGSDENIEAFHMMLEGELTGIDLLSMAKMNGDRDWEKSLYLKIVAQMVTIVEMGASRKFGYATAVKTLEKYINEARPLFL